MVEKAEEKRIPIAKDSAEGRQTEEGFFIYDGEKGVLYKLDPLAYFVWSCCDGKHTTKDIVEEIEKHTNIPSSDLKPIVSKILNVLKEANLIFWG